MASNKKTSCATREGSSARRPRGGAIAVAVALTVALAFGGVAAAKYIQSGQRDAAPTAKEFYFASDLLDGGTHEVTATVGGGSANGSKTATVTLTLQNHADDLRFSEVDIPYSVTVEPSSGVAVEPSNGTLGKDAVSDAQVTLSGLAEGTTYTVAAATGAQGESTYAKTLTGTIKVRPADYSVGATLRDGTQYVEVTVWTADYSGAVSVSYPDGLIPDNTNPLMGDWRADAGSAGSAPEISLGDHSSCTLRFFKRDDSKSYKVAGDGDSSSTSGKAVTISE